MNSNCKYKHVWLCEKATHETFCEERVRATASLERSLGPNDSSSWQSLSTALESTKCCWQCTSFLDYRSAQLLRQQSRTKTRSKCENASDWRGAQKPIRKYRTGENGSLIRHTMLSITWFMRQISSSSAEATSCQSSALRPTNPTNKTHNVVENMTWLRDTKRIPKVLKHTATNSARSLNTTATPGALRYCG